MYSNKDHEKKNVYVVCIEHVSNPPKTRIKIFHVTVKKKYTQRLMLKEFPLPPPPLP